MFTDLKPFFIWLHLHPQWAGLSICLIAFLESLALIGLLFPGIVIMTAIGSLIGTGVLPFTSIVLYAIAGAVVGDILSFWLGYHYHTNIKRMWPFCNYPKLLHKGENFFLRYGGMGVFLGRFVGPIRPLVPLVAGMMSLRPARFVFADVIANISWVLLYIFPGIVVGAASQELAPKMATQLILIVVAILLALWCVSWLLEKFFAAVIRILNYALAQLWSLIKTKPALQTLKQILMDPMWPESHSQLTLALLFLITFCLFICLTISVVHHGMFTAWNEPIYYFFRSLRFSSLDRVMVGITLCKPLAFAIMWLVVLGWLFIQRNNWAAWHWLAAGILCVGSGEILKPFIKSSRPTGLLQTPAGWSFPSGHVLASTTLLGFLVILLARNWRRDIRWLAYGCTSLIILSIMVSRLYLGSHWFTDVVGSALLGFCIATLVTLSYRRRVSAMSLQMVLSTLLIALLTLGITWSWQFFYHFKKDVQDYTPIWTTTVLDSNAWWSQTCNTGPLYRNSRFGKPIETLNIEWAGSLSNIANTLTTQQWSVLPKPSLLLAFNNLTNNKNTHQQLPILNQLYEDHKPVLVMYKLLEQSQQVLILRLWDAHLQLTNSTNIWVGTISYQKPWHEHLFHKTKIDLKQTNLTPLPAINLLATDLHNWEWKKITYPQCIDSILLVRQK